MACKLIWSPAARDDLRDIVRFIARDNPLALKQRDPESIRGFTLLKLSAVWAGSLTISDNAR